MSDYKHDVLTREAEASEGCAIDLNAAATSEQSYDNKLSLLTRDVAKAFSARAAYLRARLDA